MYFQFFPFFWAVVSGSEPQLHTEFPIAVKTKFKKNFVVKGSVF